MSESKDKVRQLEATLFAKQEEHSSDASCREQLLRENSEKISALVKDLEEQAKAKTGLESEIKVTVSLALFIISHAQYHEICCKIIQMSFD